MTNRVNANRNGVLALVATAAIAAVGALPITASAATVTLYPNANTPSGTVTTPGNAYADDLSYAQVSSNNSSEIVSGFTNTDLGVISNVTVWVNYRTSAQPGNDTYAFAAATDGTNFTNTIVAANTNNQATDVSASLSLGALTWTQVGTLAVRVVTAKSGSADGYTVDWDAAWIVVTYTPPGTLTIGDASAGEAATTLAPGAAEVPLDAFTLTATGGSGTATPSSITVTMPAGSAALIETLTIEDTSACSQVTPYGTVTNPASDAPAIPVSGLSVGASASSLWVCVKSKTHANMAAPPGTQVAVTGRVTGVVASGFTQAGSDALSAARTIDNLSPGNATSFTGTPTSGQVALTWANPAAGDLAEMIVLQRVGAAVTATPTEGVDYTTTSPAFADGSTVVYADGTGTSTTVGGLTNGTTYHYRIFARDSNGNYSTGVAAGPYTPNETTVGQGTDPGGTFAPGASDVAIDGFTLRASSGTDTVTQVAVTLSAGASYVSGVSITDGSTTYGPVTPSGGIATFSSISIAVGTTASAWSVKVGLKAHTDAAYAVPPGDAPTVTAQVTGITSGNTPSYGDTAGSIAIDNLSPGNATSFTGTAGDTQVALTWANPGAGDLAEILVLQRAGSAVTATPTEGVDYTTTSPAFADGSTVVYADGIATSKTVTGLTNGTAYHYRIFARDSSGNYSTAAAAGPYTPVSMTITIGNATTGEAATTLAPGAADVVLDAFTLTASSDTASVSRITVTMPAGSAALIETLTIENTSACNQVTPYGTATDPGSDAPEISISGLSVGTSTSNLWVCVKPKTHANVAVPPGTQVDVTGQVSAVVAAGYTQAGSDAVGPAVTIDNLSPGNVTNLTSTPGQRRVTLNWTDPVDADFSGFIVLRRASAPVADVPVEGQTYTAGQNFPSGTSYIECVGTTEQTCTNAQNLTNGTTYYYTVFARDARGNYSTGASIAETPPSGATITIGNATTGEAATTLAPGAAEVALDAFTLTASTGTAAPSSITVTTPAGSAALIETLTIENTSTCDQATPYGTVTNPGSDAPAIAISGLSVGTSASSLWVCVKPRTHANMPPPSSGTQVAVTGEITAVVAVGFTQAGADTVSAARTIDNLSPGDATSFSGTPGDQQVALTWANPAAGDLAEMIVLQRAGAAVTAVPTEGADYTTTSPAFADGSTVVYADGIATSKTVTGLTNGIDYHYKIFAKDSRGNYSTPGRPAGPYRPQAVPLELAIADGSDPVTSAICPSAAAPVDAFTMQASTGTAGVTGVTVALSPAGVYEDVWSVRVDCGAANATTNSLTSDTVAVPISVSIGSGSATSCSVTLTARDHGTLTAIGNLPVQAAVTNATASGYTVTSTDTSNGFTIDNAPPAAMSALGATPSDQQVQLSWTNPGGDYARTLLVQKLGSAVTFAPADGTDYAVGPSGVPGETVIYANTGTSHTDSPLTNGSTYHYKVVARDACNNWNAAATSSATPLAFLADGDVTAGSEKPVVSIMNPANGAVLTLSPNARVQIRAFSPGNRAFAGSEVELLVNGAAKTPTKLTTYAPTAYSGVWEYLLSAADGLAPGATVTLRARATNTAGTVHSGTITVKIAPTGAVGDGNLLVRDNASQLCVDCHALQSHTSEASGTSKGSWSLVCRDCHTPHGTRNLGLIAEQVTPPARTAPQTPKTVVYYNRTGWGASSYASNANTGPCQVCHTRTSVYRSDGTDVDPDTGDPVASGGHNPSSPCATCHSHAKGFSIVCTDCHGTAGRQRDELSVAGTVDPRLEAAPPDDTDEPPNPSNDPLRVGAHLAHVNQGTYRTNALRCADCHPSPNSHQGTRDAGWSELATSGSGYTLYPAAGSYAAWEASPTCTNWCHGAGLAGGGGTRPSGPNWTQGAQEAQCGTCHGTPPPLAGGPSDPTGAKDHPQNNACATCHGAGYGQGSLDATAKGTHVDGRIQKPQNGCTACHGKLAGIAGLPVGSTSAEAAPGYDALSYDTHGSNDRGQIGVGAHIRHVNNGLMAAKACNVCHPLPADGDTVHADGGATQMAWSSPANAGGVSPGYTAPSCTNYCHSSGDPLGAATPTTTQMSWLSTATLGCTDCHEKAAMVTNAHDVHVGALGKTCDLCHFDTTTDGNTILTGEPHHVNGTNDVAFDGSAPVAGGSYTSPSCSSIYCHSNGDPAPGGAIAYASPAWTDTFSGGNCDQCHGSPTTLVTNAHENHLNNLTLIGANYVCADCHNSVVSSGNSPITTQANHVDGTKQIAIAARNGIASTEVYASNSCDTTYCHSDGRRGDSSNFTFRTVVWTGAPWGAGTQCYKCHGTGTTTGAPDYTGTPPTNDTRNANSHAAHVGSGSDCATCHSGLVNASGTQITGSSHTNGVINVSFDSTKAGSVTFTQGTFSPPSTYASATCANVKCHGNNATPLEWGGPAQTCNSCHTRTTAQGGDLDNWVVNDDVAAIIDSDEYTAVGHGTVAAFNTSVGCLYCHDSGVVHGDQQTPSLWNPFRLRGRSTDASGATGQYSATSPLLGNDICINCHDADAGSRFGVDPDGAGGVGPLEASSNFIDAWHAGGDHAGAQNGGRRCWDCHDPHGDGTNLAMIGRDTLRSSTDDFGYVGTRSTTPAVLTTRGAGGYANNTSFNGVCQVCHTTTDFWRAGVTESVHNVGADCMTCHEHQQPPNIAFQGAGACSSCHLAPAGAGDQDVNNFVYNVAPKAMIDREDWNTYGHGATAAFAESGNPAPAFPVTQTVEGCYYCHAPDTAIPGGNGDTSTHAEVESGADQFRLTNNNWDGKGKNGTCLVCHDAASATGFDPDGANAVFTSSKLAVNRISASHYGADHAAGGKGGAFCWDCHDPHGDYNYAVGSPIAYMIQQFPTVTHSGTGGWGVPTTTAANAVYFAKGTPGSDTGAFDSLDYVRTSGAATGVCQVCHGTQATGTLYWWADGTHTGHMAGAGGARCVACHRHEQPTQDAFKQATACDACHAAPPANGKHAAHVGAATPAYGDTTPNTNPGAYAFGCGKCHATPASVHWDDVGGTATDPFVVDVAFDWTSGATPYAPGTASNDTNPTSGLVFKTTTGTCNTYCHSDGQPLGAPSPTFRAPVWNAGSASMGCTSCHGGDEGSGTPLATGKHPQHITTANPVGTAYGCIECHATVVSGNQQMQDRTLHVNGGPKNVAFQTKNGQTSAAYASPSCSSIYCHSNGRDPSFSDPARYANVAWNQAGALGCNGCHGIGQTYGMPNYPDGATLPEANSHLIHTANGTDATRCEHCHTNTVTSTGTAIKAGAPHTDGFRNVSILAAYDNDADASNNYNITSKQCSNVECHGTGTPIWGDALACNACHGAPPAAPNAGAHAKHEGTVGTLPTQYADTSRNSDTKYGIACSTCHAGTHNSDADGAPWTVEITAGLNYTGTGSTVSKTELNGQTFNWTTNKSCTTDCHSDGGRMQSNGTYVVNRINPTGWNATLGCTGCHGGGGATTTLSLAHLKHVNTGTYAIRCHRCHADTVTDALWTSIAIDPNGYNDHVNGQRSMRFDSYLAGNGTDTINNSGALLQANHTCTSTYCHSNGQSPIAPYSSTSTAWTLTTTCTSCHGGSSGTLISSGSHTAHIGTPNGYRCAVCHSTVADAANDTTLLAGGYSLHVDGTPTVAISSTYGGTFNASTNQCSNVSCHGNGTPTWGTATSVTCRTCHGKTGAGVDDDADHWSFATPIGSGIVGATNPMSRIDIDDWTSYGHGRTSALGNYAQSNNASAKLDGTTSGMTPSQDGCRYCHAPVNGTGALEHDTTMGTNPFRLVSTSPKNQVCLNCHDPSVTGSWAPAGSGLTAITTVSKISSLHAGGDHATTDAGNFCWDCHDPHGDYRYTATQQQIAYMIHEFPTTANSGASGWGIPTAVAGTAVDFRYNKDGSGSAGVFSWGDYATASPYNGVCQVCHTGTSRFLASGSTWTDDSGHNTGQGCAATCHKHQQPPTDAFKGAAGNCKGCHLDPQNGRRQVVANGGSGGDFQGRSHHVSNGTSSEAVENWDCIVCHAEGKMAANGTETDGTGFHANGTVDLLNVDSSQAWRGAGNDPAGTVGTDRWVYNKVDGISATERADLDKFCLNCHDVNGALYTYNMNPADTAWHPATPSGASNAGTVRPFGASDTVTSSNDGTIRPPSASVGGATRGTVVNVKAQFDPAGSKQAGAWTKFSYHALVFFGVSRYNSTPANGIPGWTAGNNCNGAACNDQSLMYCSDCHLSMYNSHGSQNADYMLKCYQAGGSSTCTADDSDSLGRAVGTRDGVCYRCHASGTYSDGASPTHAPPNGGDFSEQFGTTPGTRQTSSGNLFGLGCMNCHGGTTFGAIHGSSETITPVANQNTYTRKAWRFMNGAAHSEWRSDNASTTSDTGDPTQDNARWSGRTWDCYTLGTNPDRSPAYSSCTQHKTGGKTGAGSTRTLNY